MSTNHAVSELIDRLKTEFPGFELREKRNRFWTALYHVALMRYWQPGALETVTTTVGRTVYVPHLDKAMTEGTVWLYALLWHERRHIADLTKLQRRLSAPLGSVLWFLGYASPQILTLGLLGAFWSPYWLLCLLFMLPWPSPFRVWAEKRGYLASFEAVKALGVEPNIHGTVRRAFCGLTYFKMYWGNPDTLEAWFRENLPSGFPLHPAQNRTMLPHEYTPTGE